MHDSHDVLETRVFGRGKHPPRRLQLVDLPQTLDPRVVDNITLCRLAVGQSGAGGKRDIPVNRIVAEILTLVTSHARIMSQMRPGLNPPPLIRGEIVAVDLARFADGPGVWWQCVSQKPEAQARGSRCTPLACASGLCHAVAIRATNQNAAPNPLQLAQSPHLNSPVKDRRFRRFCLGNLEHRLFRMF